MDVHDPPKLAQLAHERRAARGETCENMNHGLVIFTVKRACPQARAKKSQPCTAPLSTPSV
jgi:hypothetical protein